MRYQWVGLTLLTGVTVFFQGCASIMNHDRPVGITSQPSGAAITVYDKKGEAVYEGQTPTMVTLRRDGGYFSAPKYTVAFKKDGCHDCTAEIEHDISGWYIGGNLIFGGLIGYLIIDPLTGAMWTLKDLHVDLESPPPAQLEDGARIGSLDQVLLTLRPQVVRVN
jgi:hypothetical protein